MAVRQAKQLFRNAEHAVLGKSLEAGEALNQLLRLNGQLMPLFVYPEATRSRLREQVKPAHES